MDGVWYLNNKLDVLGRLYLFGCNAMHVKQGHLTCGFKAPGVRYIQLSIPISCSWDKGTEVTLLVRKKTYRFLILSWTVMLHLKCYFSGKHVVCEAPEDDSYVLRGVSRRGALQTVFSGSWCWTSYGLQFRLKKSYDKECSLFWLCPHFERTTHIFSISIVVHLLCPLLSCVFYIFNILNL